MHSENDTAYLAHSELSMRAGFADLAAASGYAGMAGDGESGLDDEFGRWLEVQSLRFRGKPIPE